MIKEYISHSEEDTFKIAGEIADEIKKPTIIFLNGDLGAGKTHFVKGFAKAFGCSELVTSPTFTIMNEYSGGKFPIYHFDMYRLDDEEEARQLGFEEYFDEKNLRGVSLVECPENVKGLFSGKILVIKILKMQKENERKIYVEEQEC